MIETVPEKTEPKRHWYRLTGMTPRELRSDMTLFWDKLLYHILAERAHGSWNRLMFECWVQDARVIAFPHQENDPLDDRLPKVVADVSYLEETKSKLAATDSDEAAQNIRDLGHIAVRSAIHGAYRKEPAIGKLKETLKFNDFKVFTMPGGDLEQLMECEIFF